MGDLPQYELDNCTAGAAPQRRVHLGQNEVGCTRTGLGGCLCCWEEAVGRQLLSGAITAGLHYTVGRQYNKIQIVVVYLSTPCLGKHLFFKLTTMTTTNLRFRVYEEISKASPAYSNQTLDDMIRIRYLRFEVEPTFSYWPYIVLLLLAYAGIRFYIFAKQWSRNLKVAQVLSASGGLAEEFLVNADRVHEVTIDVDSALSPGEGTTETVNSKPTAPVESAVNTRRIADKVRYTQALVCEVKNRFGTPNRNAANLLAVRRFALDAGTRHGVRPTHLAQVLPMVVELTFLRTDDELWSEEMMACWEAVSRRAGASRGWYRWVVRCAGFLGIQCSEQVA